MPDTRAAWGADWSRDRLAGNAVRLAELGFGICRVYHPIDAATCSCPKGAGCSSIGKHPIGNDWNRLAERDPEKVRTLGANPGNRSLGIVPPADCFTWDVDGSAPQRLAALADEIGARLPATRVHRSGAGWHAFYRWPAGIARPSGNLFGIVTRWGDTQSGMSVAPGSIHARTGSVYTVDRDEPMADLPEAWARAALLDARPPEGPAVAGDCCTAFTPPIITRPGGRDRLRDYEAHLIARHDLPAAARRPLLLDLLGRMQPPYEAGIGEGYVDELLSWDESGHGKIERGGPGIRILSDVELDDPAPTLAEAWPEPMADAAYHGVAGELVRAVADATEADPVGLLGSILATAGALFGRHRTLYQGSAQAANVYIALVGSSSTGRKGTSASVTREIFGAAYPDWEAIVVPGLGSGEGLIRRLKPTDERNEHRALVLESELGRLLTVMARDGSTLSPALRDAWDGAPMGRFLAREDAVVLWHHVGLIGHVTPVELHQRLTSVDAANGFGNRFLWLAVRRSRLVPFPGNPRPLIGRLIEPLHRAVREAQTPAELAWTPDAADRWELLYAYLAMRQRLGLAGAITARAEAQVARLALIYALLDAATAVDLPHLEAGIAFWEYAERSAGYLFGESTGNRHADLVLRLLRTDGELDWQGIKQATGLRQGADIEDLIATLAAAELVDVVKVTRPDGTGRRRTVVRLRNSRNRRNGAEPGQERDG